jgi:hypothetical protein
MVRTNPVNEPILDEDYDVFRTTDPNVYALVLYAGLTPGQEIGLRWIALESEDPAAVGTIGTRTIRAEVNEGYSVGWITTEEMPPQGTYRAEVLLEGRDAGARRPHPPSGPRTWPGTQPGQNGPEPRGTQPDATTQAAAPLADLEKAVTARQTTLDSTVRGQTGSSAGATAGGYAKGVGPITLHTAITQ